MEEKLKQHLAKCKINYEIHKHPPVFTVEEGKKLRLHIDGVAETKNLFLKDETPNFFLVCMYAHKRLDIQSLKGKLAAKNRLTFATSEELRTHLKVAPGSVSIFSLINASDKVTLVLDEQIWQAEKVGFHPNINTATLVLDHAALEKFYSIIKLKKFIFAL